MFFLLKDGNIAVLHNKDFHVKTLDGSERLLSQDDVENMTLVELEALRIEKDKTENGGRVPLLSEFLVGSMDRGLSLIIELKASCPERAESLARAIVKQIAQLSKEDMTFKSYQKTTNYLNQLELHSFSVEALCAAKEAMLENDLYLPRGLFWASSPEKADEMRISETAHEHANLVKGDSWTVSGLKVAKQYNLEFIDLHWSVVDKDLVEMAHENGIKIIAWLVNDVEKYDELLQLGVDRILTEK